MKEITKLNLIYRNNPINKDMDLYNKINSYKKKGFYNILLYMHLGDDFYRLLVLNKYRDKFPNIHFIIPESKVFLLKFFNFNNYSIFDVNKYIENILPNTYTNDFIYETYKFEYIKKTIISYPNTEEVFAIHEKNINYKYYMKHKHIRTMCEYVKACLGIKNYSEKIENNLKISKKDEEMFLSTFKYNKDLNRIILVAPEARSDEIFDVELWNYITKKLIDKGYIVVENINDKKNHINGALNFNLTLKEIIILAKNCNSVISIRSGLCDMLSCLGKKLYVLYSKERYKDLNPFFLLKTNFYFKIYNKPKEIIIDKNSKKFIFNKTNLLEKIDITLLPGKLNKFIFFKQEIIKTHNVITIFSIKFKIRYLKYSRKKRMERINNNT